MEGGVGVGVGVAPCRKEKRRRMREHATRQTTESTEGRARALEEIVGVWEEDQRDWSKQKQQKQQKQTSRVEWLPEAAARDEEGNLRMVEVKSQVSQEGTPLKETPPVGGRDTSSCERGSASEERIDESVERLLVDLENNHRLLAEAENHLDEESTIPETASLDPATYDLGSYLPPYVCEEYWRKGFQDLRLYPWQAQCLNCTGVLGGRSIVYSAPTSGGKTLVAEILMLKRILDSKKQALLVLPFVALCDEKADHLEAILRSFNKEVFRLYGRHQMGPTLPGPEYAVIVCTIEKANFLVTRMIEEQALREKLCSVVVDEVHMLADRGRGSTIELMLSKLTHAAKSNLWGDIQLDSQERIQFVCMSATLPNVDQIANWLGAQLYLCDHRPVPLEHRMLVGSELKDKDSNVLRRVAPLPGAQDPDMIGALTKETLSEGNSVLIFCPTKKICIETANLIAALLDVPGDEELQGLREGIAYELAQTSDKSDLLKLIRSGVAYHNADLSVEERSAVERAYRSGACRVLAATSTLAAGVNLPARRVIFREPYKYADKGKTLLTPTNYKQMAGRAGRAGIDSSGESILICTQKYTEADLKGIINGPDTPIKSCFMEEHLRKNGRGMRKPMLEAICSGAVRSTEDIKYYLQSTLIYTTEKANDITHCTIQALEYLCSNRMLRWIKEEQVYEPTNLGRAVGLSGLSPEDGLLVHDDLQRARRGFVMANDLHMLYLVTPIHGCSSLQLNWSQYYERWLNDFDELDSAVWGAVELEDNFLHNKRIGRSGSYNADEKNKEWRAKRFYWALILRELVRETNLAEIAKGYGVSQSQIQVLQERSVYFASMCGLMCERLGWTDMQALIEKFQARVFFGAQADVLSLAEIPGIKTYQARILYKGGFKSPQEVLENGTIESIATTLWQADPRSRGNQYAMGVCRKVAKKIFKGAEDLLEQRKRELETKKVALESIKPGSGLNSPPSKKRDEKALLEVKSLEELDHVRTKLKACKSATFMLRMNKQHEPEQEVVGLALCLAKRKGIYVPLSASKADCELPDGFLGKAWDLFIAMLGDAEIKKGSWGLKIQVKAVMQACQSMGREWSYADARECFDLRIAAWLLQPDYYHYSDSSANFKLKTWGVLESLLRKYTECDGALYTNIGYGYKGVAGIGTVPYTCRNAACLLDLFEHLLRGLDHEDLLGCYKSIEMPLVPVLAQMESIGVPFDSSIYESTIPQLQQRLHDLTQKAYITASFKKNIHGEPIKNVFDILSPSAVARILFETLKLPPPPGSESSRKGGKGGTHFSTKKEFLEQLSSEHPLPGIILEYRQLSKLLNTVRNNLPDYERTTTTQSQIIVTCSLNSGGRSLRMTRIKGCFLQTTSETGRLQMDEPNLQCVPNKREVKVASQSQGSQGKSVRLNVNVREAFQTLEENVILSADYAQLELRLMAHFSKDEVLTKAIQGGEDFFKEIAAKWLDVKENEVDSDMRTKAKRLAYGILYGMGPERLAGELKCDLTTAKKQTEAFKKCLGGVEKWKETVISDVKKNGYVQTLGGRKRYFRELASAQESKGKAVFKRLTSDQEAMAARQAVNTTCQGSAADILKTAMINIQRRVSGNPRLGNGKCRMILEIHDELLFEIRKSCLKEAAAIIKHEMENVWQELIVPLKVRLKVGSSWGKAEPYPAE
ncbi:DNA-directed DNA polymerase [Chloropicon primus]|nr:DNA-directed DNA polymerase [Chloropicon primus]